MEPNVRLDCWLLPRGPRVADWFAVAATKSRYRCSNIRFVGLGVGPTVFSTSESRAWALALGLDLQASSGVFLNMSWWVGLCMTTMPPHQPDRQHSLL